MILEKFFTNEYDNKIFFRENDVTFGEFKDYVYAQKEFFEESEISEVALLCENYFEFAVNFFAAIFAKKQINLITDKSRLELLERKYILPQKPDKKIWQNFKNDYEPEKIMINFFTSGSTDKPKLIGKTLYNLEQEAKTTLEEFELPADCIICSTTLSSHSFGIAFNLILPFFAGFGINQTKIEFPEQFPTFENYVLISTPSFMEKLEKYDYDFTNPPKTIFLAGAKLKSSTYEYLRNFSNVIDIYGSTETGNIAYKKDGEIFTALKNVEVSKDFESKIVVKSDFFPASKMTLNDIIETVSEKQFQLKKRTDRIVKVLEKRISLDEIETHLKEFPNVNDTCCFMEENKIFCAVSSCDYDLTSKILKKYLSNYIEITPKKWRFLAEIPKTPTGKIDYEKLKRIFGLNLTMPFVLEKKSDNNVAEIKLKFKKSSNFFKGHFDIKPIVPGVVQIFFAKYFAEEIFNTKITSNNAKKIKFNNIITPDKEVTLKLENKETSVDITYLSDDKIYSSGILIK